MINPENGNPFYQIELIHQVFSLLEEPKDQVNAGRVCKLWNFLINKQFSFEIEKNTFLYWESFKEAFVLKNKNVLNFKKFFKSKKNLLSSKEKISFHLSHVQSQNILTERKAAQLLPCFHEFKTKILTGSLTLKEKQIYFVALSVNFIGKNGEPKTPGLLMMKGEDPTNINSSIVIVKKKETLEDSDSFPSFKLPIVECKELIKKILSNEDCKKKEIQFLRFKSIIGDSRVPLLGVKK